MPVFSSVIRRYIADPAACEEVCGRLYYRWPGRRSSASQCQGKVQYVIRYDISRHKYDNTCVRLYEFRINSVIAINEHSSYGQKCVQVLLGNNLN